MRAYHAEFCIVETFASVLIFRENSSAEVFTVLCLNVETVLMHVHCKDTNEMKRCLCFVRKAAVENDKEINEKTCKVSFILGFLLHLQIFVVTSL